MDYEQFQERGILSVVYIKPLLMDHGGTYYFQTTIYSVTWRPSPSQKLSLSVQRTLTTEEVKDTITELGLSGFIY